MDDEFRVLRVALEPHHVVDDREIHRALTADPIRYYRFVLQKLRAIASGSIEVTKPPKQIFSEGPGDFRVMPCVVRASDCKPKARSERSCITSTVKIIGTNTIQQEVDQITVGKAFLLHPRENYITHVFDGCLLSSARTGICAALAADLLGAKKSAATIVGAGRVGFYSALYLAAIGAPLITIADRDDLRAGEVAGVLQERLDPPVCSVPLDQAIRSAQLLVLATTSDTAFVSPEDTNAEVVVSLGADAVGQRELSDAFAALAPLYIDGLDCLAVGDCRHWLERELIRQDQLIPLEGILRGEVHEGRRIFLSTGSALLDNLTIQYLVASEPSPSAAARFAC